MHFTFIIQLNIIFEYESLNLAFFNQVKIKLRLNFCILFINVKPGIIYYIHIFILQLHPGGKLILFSDVEYYSFGLFLINYHLLVLCPPADNSAATCSFQ